MAKLADVEVGAPAPEFEAVDETGKVHRLSDYRGRVLVLYFYPKDNTPGCTTEACDFRDSHSLFLKKKAAVLGVSPDPAAAHQRFKAKHGLPFPLLVDEDKALCKSYGVWQQKTLYGRKFMGVVRSTFVIGPDGRVKSAVRGVKVAGHAQAVLEGI